jgi:S-adenosylmethionine hydrolase
LPEASLPHRPIITLTTDFGLQDHFVGTIKGVILSIAPEAEIVDITHSIQPYDILEGALTIAQTYSYFPEGTVHLVVVDPGVGGTRRPIVASSDRHHFVAPDNGVLTQISHREPSLMVRHITAASYFASQVSQTFHARDIFSPVAAHLARGVEPSAFGPEVKDFVRLAIPSLNRLAGNTWDGEILKADRFGNLITNISPVEVPMLFQSGLPKFSLNIGGRKITRLAHSYSEGKAGELFAIAGSMGYLEIAANQASAVELLGAGKGTSFRLEILA